MKGEARKAAIAAYKERKATAGIFAVRCSATGERWVGRTPDLNTVQNRLWFTLRHGSHRSRTLQAAWHRHGPDGFLVEDIELIADEAIDYVRERILKERLAHWRATLDAEAI
ncbi:GIY-YIG nuclease family protein [Chelatococcus reniformis]|uniref:GIY-YIG nuclease family protein n=1 Tax=Chelatococcus reniformis TaxID=1494448 RepID=A0A916XBU9_9HYPH|nr:GIY-YIG nuclease family protein [Chelatococcus reniformis]GGC62460.1 hypothetical protein GCM10010994_21280 [Chelatococcus reniformis]